MSAISARSAISAKTHRSDRTYRTYRILALCVLTACANTTNLLQPETPRFSQGYAPAPDSVTPNEIKVVTWNIKLGRRIDRAVEVLRRDPLANADIISLQEMDERGVDSIARALRLNYVYFPSVIHPTDRRNFGPAILSRWPIERDWKVVLPHEGLWRNQRRTATAALLRIGTARVRVYAVHLEPKFRLTTDARRDQVRTLFADIGNSQEPAVIAGDINGLDIAQFIEKSGFAWPTRTTGKTTTFFSLDHIFARGLGSADAGTVHDVMGASDHRPVWAILSVPPQLQ